MAIPPGLNLQPLSYREAVSPYEEDRSFYTQEDLTHPPGIEIRPPGIEINSFGDFLPSDGALHRRTIDSEHSSERDYSGENRIAVSESASGGVWRVMAIQTDKLLSVSYDKKARLWTTSQSLEGVDFESVKELNGHKREVLSLEILDTHRFVTGSADGILCFWDADSGELLDSLKDRHVTGFYSMAVIGENMLATGSCQKPQKVQGVWNHAIKIWDISRMKYLFALEGHTGGVSALVSLNEGRIASCSGDSTVRIWNLDTRSQESCFNVHSDYIYGLAKFEDDCLVTASKDRTVKLLDLSSETEIGLFRGDGELSHHSTVYDVNTLGANLAVSGSRDGYVKVWDRRTLQCIKTLDPQDGFVYAANFFPDGKIMAGTSGIMPEKKKTERSNKQPKRNNAHVVAWDFKFV